MKLPETVHEVIEMCAKVSDKFSAEAWGRYKSPSSPTRASSYEEGASDATDQCSTAIRALKSQIPDAPQVPSGWKLLKDSTFDERSWHEDKEQENGNYSCECVQCQRQFVGHKRRHICRMCAATPHVQEEK